MFFTYFFLVYWAGAARKAVTVGVAKTIKAKRLSIDVSKQIFTGLDVAPDMKQLVHDVFFNAHSVLRENLDKLEQLTEVAHLLEGIEDKNKTQITYLGRFDSAMARFPVNYFNGMEALGVRMPKLKAEARQLLDTGNVIEAYRSVCNLAKITSNAYTLNALRGKLQYFKESYIVFYVEEGLKTIAVFERFMEKGMKFNDAFYYIYDRCVEWLLERREVSRKEFEIEYDLIKKNRKNGLEDVEAVFNLIGKLKMK